MRRVLVEARPDFEKRNSEIGFDFGNLVGSNYWNEAVGYQFTSFEIERLYEATKTLHEMSIALAEDLVYDQKFMDLLRIPVEFRQKIQQSWSQWNYSVYGRFDFFFDGDQIKLYEFNSDTPTSLLESALVQYYWMKDRGYSDQFNSIHEQLIETWRFINEKEVYGKTIYFSCLKENQEDYRTCEYMMDVAGQAGCDVRFIFVEDVGSDGHDFYDLENKIIEYCFKLYPWEWMLDEEFGPVLPKAKVGWFEPPWRLLLSNKAMLAKMWEKYPGHELLLPTYFDKPTDSDLYVRKPIFSREGANILLPYQEETPGDYVDADTKFVWQQYKPLPDFDGWKPMIGSWVIGDQPAGLGIREDKNLVTGNLSRFTPHWFE